MTSKRDLLTDAYLRSALPGAKHLFLYRSAVATVQSMTRAFTSETDQLLRGPLLQSGFVRRMFCQRAAGLTGREREGIFLLSDSSALARARDFSLTHTKTRTHAHTHTCTHAHTHMRTHMHTCGRHFRAVRQQRAILGA